MSPAKTTISSTGIIAYTTTACPPAQFNSHILHFQLATTRQKNGMYNKESISSQVHVQIMQVLLPLTVEEYDK